MKSIRYLCAQPATPYYAWQIETMLANFYAMGINPNQIDIVCEKPGCQVPPDWQRLAETYPSRFFFYCDRRQTKHYISSIRPNILRQHWEAHPEMEGDTIFYHDCDMIFTQPPSQWISKELISDKIWYGSDVKWYIGYPYIISKGEDIAQAMFDIMHIDGDEVMQRSDDGGDIGAQYLMKGVDASFWYAVEQKSEVLFKEISALNAAKKLDEPSYHEIQIWTADMWALLWTAWKRGITTKIDKAFDFAWGTSGIKEIDTCNIMHNAGVTTDSTGLFYKANYIDRFPYNLNLDIRKDMASSYYYYWVQQAEKNSILI